MLRRAFHLSQFRLHCGDLIPLDMGFETYGTLNKAGDNAILLSHYFSAFGHGAGKYTQEDSQAGYWDALVGPEKAIDTKRCFVVSIDNICNIQVKNPHVITTGPATLNPDTGKPYGLRFPVVSTLDLALAQKALLESLGVQRLKAATGPSLGGMIALQLGVHCPDFVESIIGVVTAQQNALVPSFQNVIRAAAKMDENFKNGDYYGEKEPDKALLLVTEALLLNAYTSSYIETLFPRDNSDDAPYLSIQNRASYEVALERFARGMMTYFDFNSFIYASRITMNHNIARGFSSLDHALEKIQAKCLFISCREDCLVSHAMARDMAQRLVAMGKRADFHSISSPLGHMAGVFAAPLFAPQIQEFLEG